VTPSSLTAAGTAGPQVQIFLTSIFTSTIMEAWSSIVQSLLRPHVGVFQSFARALVEANDDWLLEAAVLDRSTFLCLALASQFDAQVAPEFSAGLKKAKLLAQSIQAATLTHRGHCIALQPLTDNTMLLVVGHGSAPAELVRWNAEAAATCFVQSLEAASMSNEDDADTTILRELWAVTGPGE